MNEFVTHSLSFSPISASSAGYHEHQGQPLDNRIDDLSEQNFAAERKFYHDFAKRLDERVATGTPHRPGESRRRPHARRHCPEPRRTRHRAALQARSDSLYGPLRQRAFQSLGARIRAHRAALPAHHRAH
ncbi:MAG: hypothetical protein WDN31_11105 [Hyphomicrobium sp.]